MNSLSPAWSRQSKYIDSQTSVPVLPANSWTTTALLIAHEPEPHNRRNMSKPLQLDVTRLVPEQLGLQVDEGYGGYGIRPQQINSDQLSTSDLTHSGAM